MPLCLDLDEPGGMAAALMLGRRGTREDTEDSKDPEETSARAGLCEGCEHAKSAQRRDDGMGLR